MRVRFPSGQQRLFIESVQEQTKASMATLAAHLGLCARTVRDWRRERWQIDDRSLNRLCQLAHLPPPTEITLLSEYWSVAKASRLGGLRYAALYGSPGTLEGRQQGGVISQAIIRQNPTLARLRGISVRKPIKVPRHSEDLAEFMGVFLGDGGFRNGWQVDVSFNYRLDIAYAKFLTGLIKETLKRVGISAHARQFGQRVFVDSERAVQKYFAVVGTHNPRYQQRFRRYLRRGARDG